MSEQPWPIQPASELNHTWLTRRNSITRKPALLVNSLRTLAALPLRAYLHTYHRLQILGQHHLPRAGSFVLVANHASHLDTLCLLSALSYAQLHRTFPAAAQDYFFVGLPRLALAALLIKPVPFARQVHTRQSLNLCRKLLANSGNILILFPEGTRTTTGQLSNFRPGIGSLVAGTNIPVIPCALHGAFQAWPKGALLPRPRSLRLIIGPPRRYADLPSTRDSVHHIAQDLHTAVQELLCP